MSSRKLNLPSSSRQHIKLDTFSQFVSAARIRHVQNILHCSKVGSPDIDGILCIAGVDSHFNEGMYELISYLLFGFFDVCKDELERSGFAEEVIEDLIIFVDSDHVEVYCNPVNYRYILPYVSHWPGLKMHCLNEIEYEGEEDASEEFKINSFISMVSKCKVVGFPYSGRGHKTDFDIMALEKWPIIQAFALDDFKGGGFFTMKFEVVDVSDEVHRLFDYMDPASVEILLTEHFPLMLRQWDNMMKCVQMSFYRELSSLVIAHRNVSEPLLSYFNHGHLGNKGRNGIVPFVVFAPDSEKRKLEKIVCGENIQLSDLHHSVHGTSHMICQIVSPNNPLMCARTYFLCDDAYSAQAETLGSFRNSAEIRYSVGIYLAMVKATVSAIEKYARTSSITKAETKCLEILKICSTKLGNPRLLAYLSNSANVVFTMDTLASDEKNKSLAEGENNSMMKYVSLTLYDIPALKLSSTVGHIGSMVFAETFLDSRLTVAGSSNVSSDYLIMTTSIQRHQMWSMSGCNKNQSMEVLFLPADQWGEPLLTRGEVQMMCTWTALLPPEKILLSIWKHGLAVQSKDYGSFALHGSSVSYLSLYDGNSMSQLAILTVEIKLTDTLRDSLPPHLYTEFDDCGIGQILFAFCQPSKSYTQLYGSVLPAWKSGSQFPSVERLDVLDSQLGTLYTYLLNKLNLSSARSNNITGLKKVGIEMPNLFSFLEHLNNSCGLQNPVTHKIFQSLTEFSVSSQGVGDDTVVITIITGLPCSGKEILAASLTSHNRNFTNWLVYKQPQECQLDTAFLHQSMSNASLSRNQWLLTKSTRFIIVAPGFCDTAEVVRAVCNHPDHKLRSDFIIGSVTLCIDPNNTFMEHRMTFPVLTSNCAQGWVNNIFFTSPSQSQHDLLEDIMTLIRTINSDVAFLKSENGQVKRTTDFEMITSESAFSNANWQRARVLLKPYWCEGYPHAWSCDPPMKDVILRFNHPLDKHLTKTNLRAIKNSLKCYPYDGNIYFVKASLIFSGSPAFVDLQFATLSGKLVINETKMTHSVGERKEGVGEGNVSFVCFTGVGLTEQDLKQFLSACIKQRPEKKQLLTREDLTKEDIDKIHKAHHLDDLPEGWFYNGSRYVSMDGERSLKHPNLAKFIQEYLDKKNAEIEKYNAQIESQVYVTLWQQ